MTARDLDVLIISDKGGYENIAFPHQAAAQLCVGDKIMTLQNLRRRFEASSGEGGKRQAPVSLEDTAKLNGLYLYDYCRARGLTADVCVSHDPNNPAFRAAAARRPRCVAVSTTYMLTAGEVQRAVRDALALCPDAFIVVGGPLIYNCRRLAELPDEDAFRSVLQDRYFFQDPTSEIHRGIDLFVVDEQGEDLLVEIVRRVKRGANPETVPNCAVWKDGRLAFTPAEERPILLDEHVMRWDELPNRLLPDIAPVRLSVGCPFRCGFCDFSTQRRYRKAKWAGIREELSRLKRVRNRIRFLRFVDDTLSTAQLRELCRLMLELHLELPWTSFARADSITPEIAALLRAAGCQSVQLGLESGDDTILHNMNKRVTSEKYLEILGFLNRAGVNVQASFIVGFPGETPETVANTLRFLERVPTAGEGLFEYAVAPFIVLPLSPVHRAKQRRRFGLEGVGFNWQHRTMSSDDVPQYVAQLLFAPKNDVFARYPGDEFNPDIPPNLLKEILRVRRDLKRLEISAAAPTAGQDLWQRMEELFKKTERVAAW